MPGTTRRAGGHRRAHRHRAVTAHRRPCRRRAPAPDPPRDGALVRPADRTPVRDRGGSDALAARLAPGPAWTRHAGGPWPEPHDPIFDFTTTPAGWEWLDDYARAATTELARLRGASPSVIAHADWYAGNLRLSEDRVVATFDWELFAEEEAVIVGLSAGGYLTDDAPTPVEVADYLRDYNHARPLDDDARRAAAAAARWMLAFNARCDLALADGAPVQGSALHRLVTARDAYLRLN